MAAPTLQLRWDDFIAEVGWYLGYGRGVPAGGSDQEADIERIVHEGLRRFYFPPPLPGEATGWSWSFLKPVASLTLQAPYSTGTVKIDAATLSTVDGTSTVFPLWAVNGVINISGIDYEVSTRDSNTKLTLVTAASAAVAAGTEYSLGQWNYTLPDNFGAMEGDLTFMQSNSTYQSIPITSEAHLRKLRSQRGVGFGDSFPRYAAIRPLAGTSKAQQTDGVAQNYELMVWPRPDATYHLEYRYMVMLNKLDTTNSEPMGGPAHSSTIMASCLAVAEEQRSKVEKVGVSQQAAFMRLLAASVAFDRRAITPETLGYNRDNSDAIHASGPWEHRHRRQNLLNVSHNGTTYFN